MPIGHRDCSNVRVSETLRKWTTAASREHQTNSVNSVLRNTSTILRVSLPGVGAHLQDQSLALILYDTNLPSHLYNTYNSIPLSGSVTAQDLFGSDLANVSAKIYQDLPRYAQILAEASNGAISAEDQMKILKLRAHLVFEQGVTIGAMDINPGFSAAWGTMPWSTGSVHVSRPRAYPLHL